MGTVPAADRAKKRVRFSDFPTRWRPDNFGGLKMAGSKTRIMYIEVKSGHSDRGPARIGRISFSATGRTLYYRGRSFQSCKGQGIGANYFDVEIGEEYWISGPKKNLPPKNPLLA